MKKTLALLLVLLLTVTSVFAVVNNQKVYSVTDDVYSNIETLYISSGYGLPSSSGPWTGSELLLMMEKIDRDSLSQVYKNLYDSVMKTLEPTADFEFDTVSLDFGLELNLEAYLRSNAAKNATEYQNAILEEENVAALKATLMAVTNPGLIQPSTTDMSTWYFDASNSGEVFSLEGLNTWTSRFVQSSSFNVSSIAKKMKKAGQKTFDDLKAVLADQTLLATNEYKYISDFATDYMTGIGRQVDITNLANEDTQNLLAALLGQYAGDAALDEITSQYMQFMGVDTHTYDNMYNGYSEWAHGEDSRSPFLTFDAEVWAAKNFYGYFEFALGDNAWKYLYQKQFSHNFNFLTTFDVAGTTVPRFATISWQTPQKALASVGGDHWSLVAGRDKLSWGSGVDGNLILSSSFDNHTFAQFTTFHKNFSYTLLTTFYPYYGGVYEGHYRNEQDSDLDNLGGFKSFLAHRLEYSMFKNKLNLSVTEAVMIRKLAGSPFSLAMLNPFGFLHNEYTRSSTNSILYFEADWTPFKGVNLYGQFAVDDFSIPGQSDDVVPDANGFMIGAKSNFGWGPGILSFDAQYTKTSPYLYLRGAYEDQGHYGYQNAESYGLGFDAVTRYFSLLSAITYSNDFITYKYGNDMIVVNVDANYIIPEKFEFSLGYTGLTSGLMNINSPWGQGGTWEDTEKKKHEVTVNYDVTTPSTTDPFYNGPEAEEKTGAVEYTNIITFTGSWKTPIKGLSLSVIADIITCNNYNNIEGYKFNDIQITAGAKYAL